MRLEFDKNGYVSCLFLGCFSEQSIVYTGLVPNEPEEYEDLYDWADRAIIQAYYLDDNGNLAYDLERAESLPPEDAVVLTPYTVEQVKQLGIFDAIYPVGSLYMSLNDVNPSILFGGTWVKIEDRFLLAAGSNYEGGTENADGVSSQAVVNIPAHKHLTPLMNNGVAFGIWTGGEKEQGYAASNRLGTTGAAYSDSYTANTYYTATDGASRTVVTVPPTLPPYMAVFVWQRIDDPISDHYESFIDCDGHTVFDKNGEEILVKVE